MGMFSIEERGSSVLSVRQKWLLDAFKSSYNRYCYPIDTKLLAKTFSIALVQMPFVGLIEQFAIIYLFMLLIAYTCFCVPTTTWSVIAFHQKIKKTHVITIQYNMFYIKEHATTRP